MIKRNISGVRVRMFVGLVLRFASPLSFFLPSIRWLLHKPVVSNVEGDLLAARTTLEAEALDDSIKIIPCASESLNWKYRRRNERKKRCVRKKRDQKKRFNTHLIVRRLIFGMKDVASPFPKRTACLNTSVVVTQRNTRRW